MQNTPPEVQLFLVMPVYNEQDCIKKVLNDWITTLSPLNVKKTFIVINDGSTDQTSQILKDFKKAQEVSSARLEVLDVKNAGHGAAILTGYQKAIELSDSTHKSFVFQTDSDDQFESRDFFKLWELNKNYDFIFGHREIRHDAKNRLFISKILRILVRLYFGVKTYDPNIPFRLMETRSLEIVLKKLPKDLFAPNIFITVLALLHFSKKTKQGVSVLHKARETGQVSIVSFKLLKVCFKSLKQLIAFKIISRV